MRKFPALIALATFVLLGGCACPRSIDRAFAFPGDSFAFSNELRWHYEFADGGSVTTRKNEPPPRYSLRCFPMVRAAREFFYHAEFRPDRPQLSRDAYRKVIKEVLARSSRCPAKSGERIVIPGYRDLHEFSTACEDLLKNECGGATASFFQRGNWRMVFPLFKRNRRHTAEQFLAELARGEVPIAHVYRFPNTTLNHAIMIYAAERSGSQLIFSAYDPNDSSRPATLKFDYSSSVFSLERTPYFAGGAVKVYEVYRGVFY